MSLRSSTSTIGRSEESERWAGEAIRIAKLRLGPADPTFDIAYPLHLRIQLSSKRGAADVSEADADELFDSLRMAPGLDKDQGRRRHVDFLNLIGLSGTIPVCRSRPFAALSGVYRPICMLNAD